MSQKWTSCLQGKFVGGHTHVESPLLTAQAIFPQASCNGRAALGQGRSWQKPWRHRGGGQSRWYPLGYRRSIFSFYFWKLASILVYFKGSLNCQSEKKNSKCTHKLFYSNIWDQLQLDKTLTLKKSWLFLCTDCKPKIATKNTWSPETPSPHSNGRRDLRIRLHKATQSPPSV